MGKPCQEVKLITSIELLDLRIILWNTLKLPYYFGFLSCKTEKLLLFSLYLERDLISIMLNIIKISVNDYLGS